MKLLTTLLSAGCLLVIGSTNVAAQDGPLTWAPMEIYGCTFNDGANMDDLNAVIDSWNEWMDETGQGDYTGIVLTPHFTSATFTADLLWVGVWQDAAGLAGMQQWLTEGSDLYADFGEVVTCPMHTAYAVANVQQMAEPEGIVPVAFQNCTIAENRGGADARGVIEDFAAYLAEQGHNGGHFVVRPAAGENQEATYSFKWVRSHPSWAAIGDYFDIVYNQGGFGELGGLMENVMSCDSPRVYNTRMVRQAAEEE